MAARADAVRAGDVFRFGTERWATVMAVLPGGIAQLRFSGTRQGRPTLSVGDARVSEVKTWERAGRAQWLDGCYLPLDHVALANGR